jgi:histidinol-phosphate aminotransferase
MAPYAPPDDPDTIAAAAGVTRESLIKLDANENPYGASPAVRAAIADFAGYHLYPDPDQRELRSLIAAYAGVDSARVMAGNGSDELIDLLCRIYLEPGDQVVDCTPTFGMYRFSAELCGAEVLEAPRTSEWEVDSEAVESVLTDLTKLIFVASPNNPSGNLLDSRTLATLVELGPLVVVDEAYIEFSDGASVCQLVSEQENLIVLRTFSKWAGLAGLRLGYGVFPEATLHPLWKVKPPFNVNLAATAAVRGVLADLTNIQLNVRRIADERARMVSELAEIDGLRVWPSRANFVLVQVERGTAAGLKDFLARRGIAVRAYSHPRLQSAIRISVGLSEHTDALMSAILSWREHVD